jgi:hypothetical protein
MAILIKEYLGSEGIKVDWNYKAPVMTAAESAVVSNDPITPDSLMADIEGIHSIQTRNFTWYMDEALQDSVPTWIKPYLRPVIMHHNEKDGRIIGRIRFATYTNKNTLSGTGALVFTVNVPDKEGKEQLLDGRLKTTSIGVIVHDCRCSICGHNIATDGPCEHERGKEYDGKICYWMIYKMEAKELSFVIVPSDIYSQCIRIYKPSQAELKESSEGVLNLSEATKLDANGQPITEGTVIDENGNKPADATPAAPETQQVDVAALQKQIDTLTQRVADLEKENETLLGDKEKVEGEKKDAVKNLEDTKVLLDQAQKNLKAAQDSLVLKEADLVKANQLRESLETQLIEANTSAKVALIEKVELMRKTLGKPIMAREELEKRSEESLKDSILDLTEEMNKPSDVSQISSVSNPSIVENTDPSNVKNDKKPSNIDLVEGLESIFSELIGPKR